MVFKAKRRKAKGPRMNGGRKDSMVFSVSLSTWHGRRALMIPDPSSTGNEPKPQNGRIGTLSA
jgi:hypothetical protein